jgi:probable phosphoglycerate mutase
MTMSEDNMSEDKVFVPWDAGCSWYLVRHGETEWNRTRRIQGQSDPPLNEHGSAQAARLSARLAGNAFSAVYASDLTRTMQTAESVVSDSGVAVAPVPELREFAYGEWEGLTFAEVEARDREGFAARMMRRNSEYAPPGGESVGEVVARVRAFHDGARARHGSGENVLVVGHGGSLLALLICLLGLPDEHILRFRLSNASLSVVRTFSDAGVLELWNDTSHLTALATGEE